MAKIWTAEEIALSEDLIGHEKFIAVEDLEKAINTFDFNEFTWEDKELIRKLREKLGLEGRK